MPKHMHTEPPHVIVGIGSSAGGLEAIRELVSNLPDDIGCSYVIIQHMSPQHKSLMTQLVGSETSLMVMDIIDQTEPAPNVIYVTPPNTDVIFEEGRLKLLAASDEAIKPKPSVDRFLNSLAAERGDRTMGIILSGTGSDGAYGIQAIHEAGGITIAQDDISAKYDGMPNAAVATGCVDLVLRPEEIALHLKKILSLPRDLEQFKSHNDELSPVSGILQIVLARTRVDFREYKQTTVMRRIDRRMTALGMTSIEDYASHCRNDPNEVDALFKDLLISVTRFFRDPEEFKDLETYIQELVDHRNDRPLRIWVAGCATGEEVYSIAILLAEAMGGAAQLVQSKTQIFATDIDRNALKHARQGQYSQGALLDVSKAHAEKYFIQKSEGLQIVEALRSVILFSDHNICQDPPFLNMDLICCRNLMIYFSSKLQSRVFGRLHYAMKPTAYLFVGRAETAIGSDQLFSEVNDNPRIFRKRMLRPHDNRLPSALTPNRSVTYAPGHEARTRSTGRSLDNTMFDALARALGENSILVSSDHKFLRVYGDITPYITFTEDSALSLHLSLLRSPFREEARSLVTLALKNDEKRMGNKHVMIEQNDQVIRLEVFPIQAPSIDERLALIVIDSWSSADHGAGEGAASAARSELSDEQLKELEKELATARETLQQTVEELETSNEELQSLNEELQSTNEELQATNEELETSNEELQSTNEELITVNEELQVNSSELMGLNAELGSLLGNVPVPLIVLDNALQVVRTSKAAASLFKIADPLRNPHLSQIPLPEGFPKVVELCNEALHLGLPLSRSFETRDGPYTLQCAPFAGENGQIIGTTLVLLNFQPAPSLATELTEVLEKAPVYLLQHDDQGKLTRISEKMAALLDLDPQEAIGTSIDAIGGITTLPRDHGLQMLLAGQTVDQPFQMSHPNGTALWLSAVRHAFTNPQDQKVLVAIVGSDVTSLMAPETSRATQPKEDV